MSDLNRDYSLHEFSQSKYNMKKKLGREVTQRQIQKNWGKLEIWDIVQSQLSNTNSNWSGFQPLSNNSWGYNSGKTSSGQGFIEKRQWGDPSSWNNRFYYKPGFSNKWGHPSQWNSSEDMQLGEQNSEGNTINKDIQPVKISHAPSNNSNNKYSMPSNSSWGFNFIPIPNSSCSQSHEGNLKGSEFFEYLKKQDIDDEVICLLCNQGIDSLQILRECSQQALVGVGIKLLDVIKLKKL